MITYYTSAYIKFVESALDNTSGYKELGNYAILINEKANALLQRASKDNRIDAIELQTELFKIGKQYVQEFSRKHDRAI